MTDTLLDPAAPLQIAPLVWDGSGRAKAVLGAYEIIHFPPTGAWMWEMEGGTTSVARGGDISPGFPDEGAARADAERDHQERLGAWLQPAPAPDYAVTDASIELFSMCLAKIETAQAEGYADPLADHQYASLEYLIWMGRTAIETGPSLPEDKVSRWLGFVQGGLAVRDLLDVGEERAVSREKFHRAYVATGLKPPASLARDLPAVPAIDVAGAARMDDMVQAGAST